MVPTLPLPYLNVDQAWGPGFPGECNPHLQPRGGADVVFPEHQASKACARRHHF